MAQDKQEKERNLEREFLYNVNDSEYDFQLKKKPNLWWLLLLLLPLLLLIPLKKDITVVTRCDGQPEPYVDVSMNYTARYLLWDKKFNVNMPYDTIQQTDSEGRTVFKDLGYSVYSLLFHFKSPIVFSASHNSDSIVKKCPFHTTREVIFDFNCDAPQDSVPEQIERVCGIKYKSEDEGDSLKRNSTQIAFPHIMDKPSGRFKFMFDTYSWPDCFEVWNCKPDELGHVDASRCLFKWEEAVSEQPSVVMLDYHDGPFITVVALRSQKFGTKSDFEYLICCPDEDCEWEPDAPHPDPDQELFPEPLPFPGPLPYPTPPPSPRPSPRPD